MRGVVITLCFGKSSTINKLVTHFVQITLHLHYTHPLHIADQIVTSVVDSQIEFIFLDFLITTISVYFWLTNFCMMTTR